MQSYMKGLLNGMIKKNVLELCLKSSPGAIFTNMV